MQNAQVYDINASQALQAGLAGYLTPSQQLCISIITFINHRCRLIGQMTIEMNVRLSYHDKETACLNIFNEMGEVYHGCTPENHPIIIKSNEEFKTACTLLAICRLRYPKIIILTFELMNNHLHIVAAGDQDAILMMFAEYKTLLEKYFFYKEDSGIELNEFKLKLHKITDLENLRNVIAYVNRNGSVVDENHSPYSYLWGANRFYFNTEAAERHNTPQRFLRVKECRALTHSRKYDGIGAVPLVDGYASPLHFCDISTGEKIFRDARHYFYKISKNIESYEEIARMIGENIFYTDNDMFQIACTISRKEHNCSSPHLLSRDGKIKLAKILHYDYNATLKQVQRMLKIDVMTLKSLFGE